MADFSAKHYMIKSEKNAVRASEEADRAKGYADSLQPETFVKTSGDQTIEGHKTFSRNVYLEQGQNDKLFLKDTRVDASSETGTDTFNTIIFRDKNNFNYANVAVQDEADGGKRLRLLVQNKLTNGTTKSEQIWIAVEKNGNVTTYAPTPPASNNSTQIATTAWVSTKVASSLPAGTIIAFAANSAPSGFILCNGAKVSRTTYASLFKAIGTIYGTGDGSTTFNLPNLTDKFIMGSGTAGTSKAAGLPNITGSADWEHNGSNHATSRVSGALYVADGTGQGCGYGGNSSVAVKLDASKSNSIYGKSTTVQPPALTMRFYIKY